jgi:hypothetical protein
MFWRLFMFKKLLPLLFLFAGFQANAAVIIDDDYGRLPVFNATLTGTTGAGHWMVNGIQFGAGVDFSALFRLVGYYQGHPRFFEVIDTVLTIGSETSIPLRTDRNFVLEYDIGDRRLELDTNRDSYSFVLKLNRIGVIKPPLPRQDPPAILWHIPDIVGDYKGEFLIDGDLILFAPDGDSCGCAVDVIDHEVVSFSIVRVLDPSIVAVPEPSIIALFGLGLVGIGFARRRQY